VNSAAGPGNAGRRRHPRHAPEARERLILAAANRLFLQQGYESTSINDVIRIAGGSKATLAGRFGNKAGLFAAVIRRYADGFAAELRRAAATHEPRAGLRAAGEMLLRFYLEPASLQAYRGVIAAGPRHPELARIFYEQGHLQVVSALAGALRDWQRRGLLVRSDPVRIADRFAHLLRHGLYEQRLIGYRRTAPAAAIRRQARAAADTLLDGLRRRRA